MRDSPKERREAIERLGIVEGSKVSLLGAPGTPAETAWVAEILEDYYLRIEGKKGLFSPLSVQKLLED